jgi:threonine/homoserine/homoserine lactone efflux protein
MPSVDTSLAFSLVALLLALTPGPDNLFVLMLSASQGRRAGIWVILGLCTGLIVHTAAVAFGLAALFAASSTAFAVLKYAGAAYLAYLAWQAFRAPVGTATDGSVSPTPALQLYGRGILMNLTNPKVVLFFLAFLPQFVDPKKGAVAGQLAVLGGLFIVATLIAFVSIACATDFIGARLRRSAQTQRLLNRASACVFAGLAVKLAVTQR